MHKRTNAEIIAEAQQKLKDQGNDIWNLSALRRETGFSRNTLRKFRDSGIKDHGNKGKRQELTILTPFESVINETMKHGNHNAANIFRRLQKLGYPGGQTTVKQYVREHRHLLPQVVRQKTVTSSNRGRRYSMKPGECYQMDWGFINAVDDTGKLYRLGCFALVCAHCSKRYIEFFTNARQENLFIGMIHGFQYLGGIPPKIMTDNMKSVVTRRDQGEILWNPKYRTFMNELGFSTILNKPRHAFTKGKVERLVHYVKQDFILDRSFSHLGDLNSQALQWCDEANSRPHSITKRIPETVHATELLADLPEEQRLFSYLAVRRAIAFDGCVSFEGFRYGTPYTYHEKYAFIMREGDQITLFGRDRSILFHTSLDWVTAEYFHEHQWHEPDQTQPSEQPSQPIGNKTIHLRMGKKSIGIRTSLLAYDLIDDNRKERT